MKKKRKGWRIGLPLYKLTGRQVFILLVLALIIGGLSAAKSYGFDFLYFIQLWL